MIVSSAHLTIARHYCGGKVAGRVISLSGKLATCGMETTKEKPAPAEQQVRSHCCENKISTIGIVNIFTAPVLVQNDKLNFGQDLSFTHENKFNYNILAFNNLFTNVHPPGWSSASAVDLNSICVSRV